MREAEEPGSTHSMQPASIWSAAARWCDPNSEMPSSSSTSAELGIGQGAGENLLRHFAFDTEGASVHKSPEEMRAELERLREGCERTAALRRQIETWHEEDSATRYLERLGPKQSLELLRELFGRRAIDSAFRAPGRTAAPKQREFFIWFNVELHRAVKRTTIEKACRWLARVGVRGWHEDRRGSKRSVKIDHWRTLEGLHGDAEKKMRHDMELRRRQIEIVTRYLIFWQESGKPYEAWHKERLLSPRWAYPSAARTPRLLQRD